MEMSVESHSLWASTRSRHELSTGRAVGTLITTVAMKARSGMKNTPQAKGRKDSLLRTSKWCTLLYQSTLKSTYKEYLTFSPQ